jgi:hypothetical protein
MARRILILARLILGAALGMGHVARADFDTPTFEFKTNNLNTNYGFDPANGINTSPATMWSIYPGGLALSNPLQLPQFNPNDPTMVAPHDPNLTAVLTGVNITASYSLNNALQYVYTTAGASLSVRADGSLTLPLPSSTPLTFPVAPVFHDGYNPDGTPLFRPFNPATDQLNVPINVPVTSPSSFTSQFFASNGHDAVSAQYVGTSTISVPIVASARSAFDVTNGNGFGQSITLAQLDLKVFYTYALVPEPSAMALVLIGGGISALVFRRRLLGRPRDEA